MRDNMRAYRGLKAIPVMLILALPFAACDSLLDTSEDFATSAQVIVTGTSAVPLGIIMSNDFNASRDELTGETMVSLFAADTLSRDVPINENYPITDRLRFFVRLINPSADETATVNMRVLLDGKDEVYNVNVSLKDASIQYIFSYF